MLGENPPLYTGNITKANPEMAF